MILESLKGASRTPCLIVVVDAHWLPSLEAQISIDPFHATLTTIDLSIRGCVLIRRGVILHDEPKYLAIIKWLWLEDTQFKGLPGRSIRPLIPLGLRLCSLSTRHRVNTTSSDRSLSCLIHSLQQRVFHVDGTHDQLAIGIQGITLECTTVMGRDVPRHAEMIGFT